MKQSSMLKEINCKNFIENPIKFSSGLNSILGDNYSTNSIGKSKEQQPPAPDRLTILACRYRTRRLIFPCIPNTSIMMRKTVPRSSILPSGRIPPPMVPLTLLILNSNFPAKTFTETYSRRLNIMTSLLRVAKGSNSLKKIHASLLHK